MVGDHLAGCIAGRGAGVIRVSHVTLPAGLSALARRGPDGELRVYVSDALPPDRQRAAVRVAVRASRPERWRTLVPVPSAALLVALGGSWLRRAARVLRVHPVAWGTASAVLVAASAAVYFAAAPHGHSPGSSAPPARHTVPGASQSAVSRRPAAHPRASHRGRSHPAPGTSVAAAQGAPGSPVTVAAVPPPSSTPSSSVPTPSASPAPAPRASSSPGGAGCIRLLGIRVCLGLGI